MPRVSITIEDGPNKGEWSARYVSVRSYRSRTIDLDHIRRDNQVVRQSDAPDEALFMLEAKAEQDDDDYTADAQAEQADLKRMQKEDGD